MEAPAAGQLFRQPHSGTADITALGVSRLLAAQQPDLQPQAGWQESAPVHQAVVQQLAELRIRATGMQVQLDRSADEVRSARQAATQEKFLADEQEIAAASPKGLLVLAVPARKCSLGLRNFMAAACSLDTGPRSRYVVRSHACPGADTLPSHLQTSAELCVSSNRPW